MAFGAGAIAPGEIWVCQSISISLVHDYVVEGKAQNGAQLQVKEAAFGVEKYTLPPNTFVRFGDLV